VNGEFNYLMIVNNWTIKRFSSGIAYRDIISEFNWNL